MTYSIQDLQNIAVEDATNQGIDPTIFLKQINQESAWNPNAVSTAGAIGIAQFMPSTAQAYAIDPYDPIASLQAAAKYDRNALNQIGAINGQYTSSDYAKMLATYNEGYGNLQYQMNAYGNNWLDASNTQT